MIIDFTGKRILVTGGTRGIGAAIAQGFVRAGGTVTITGTSPSRPESVPSELHYEPLIIAENEPWYERLETIVQDAAGFHCCVNNAGINRISPITEQDAAAVRAILLTNLEAPLAVASICARSMIHLGGGSIVNIASIFGVVSKKGRTPYTASKSGLIGATKTMALDLAEHRILVNAVSPGFVDTELTRRVLGESGMAEMAESVPLGRLAVSEEIVPTVLFLSSSLNSYITGQNIIVDGGFTLA